MPVDSFSAWPWHLEDDSTVAGRRQAIWRDITTCQHLPSVRVLQFRTSLRKPYSLLIASTDVDDQGLTASESTTPRIPRWRLSSFREIPCLAQTLALFYFIPAKDTSSLSAQSLTALVAPILMTEGASGQLLPVEPPHGQELVQTPLNQCRVSDEGVL